MDDFATKMLEKAEKRNKNLGLPGQSPKPLAEVNSDIDWSSSSGSGIYSGSPRTKVTRFDGSKENSDTNVEINITAPSNVQVEVEVSECDIDEYGNVIRNDDSSSTSSKAIIRDTSRSHLKRLGDLYAEKDISSPIHRTEQNFCEEPIMTNTQRNMRSNRLANLASVINNWEDDPSHPNYKDHRKTVNPGEKRGATPKKSQAPQPPVVQKPVVSPKKPVVSPRKAPAPDPNSTKTLNWDSKVMSHLESQGFTRRESSTTKLTYDYAKSTDKPDASQIAKDNPFKFAERHIESREMPREKPKAPKPPPTTSNVRDRAALFDKRKSIFAGRDPTELSIKDRMAIFEKNKGSAPVPKVPFSQNIPAQPAKPTSSIQRPVLQPIEERVLSPKKTVAEVTPETKATGKGVLHTLANLLSKEPTISESKIAEQTRKERQEEMNVLLNRYKTNEEQPIPKAPPLPPPGYLQSPDVQGTLKRRSGDLLTSPSQDPSNRQAEEVKRARTGRLYPVLSDIESASTDQDYTTASVSPSEAGEEVFLKPQPRRSDVYVEDDDDDDDSFMESDDICNSSLGRSVLRAVQERSMHNSSNRRDSYHKAQEEEPSYTSSSDISDVLHDMDEYLDEALEEEEEDDDEDQDSNTPTKTSISSSSFRYDPKTKRQVRYQSIPEESETESLASRNNYKSPVKSELTVDQKADMVTLTHTVSFYRRQQQAATSPSSRERPTSVVESNRRAPVPVDSDEYEDSDDDDDYYEYENTSRVQEKIKKLLDEVCKQQTAISQTSQALNLCAATIEFSNSTESVECERHLLVATHRRQACLDEVQRLRVEGCLRPEGAPIEKGRLTIKDITVPLKQDYIRKLAANAITGHHLVCLLKYNETVLATKTVPTLPGLLAVKFPDVLQLNNVFADFKITLEIYGMTAENEILPHDVKYHLASGKKAKKTPATPQKTPKKKNKQNPLVVPPVQSPAGPNAVLSPTLIQYGFIIFSLREIQRTTWSLNSVGGLSPLEGQIHMRVNCELSVSVGYRGFLTMYEDVSGFGAWHRRWCRLQGHMISYWLYPDDEKKKAPLGSIDLTGCCTKNITTAPREVCARLNTFLLEFKRPAENGDKETLTQYRDGKYTVSRRLLSADTKDEREQWCNQLNRAVTLFRAWGNSQS